MRFMPPLIVALLMIVACKPDSAPSRTRKPPRAGSGSAAPAPVEARIAAIGDTSYLSPELQRAFDPADDFLPMPEPEPNDWLAEHPEPPQTFEQFLRADTHVPGGGRTVIYLLPIGEFSASAPALTSLSAIVHAFFTLEVRILPAVPLSEPVATTRINEATHKRQLLAPDVLAWLAKRLPEDAFGLVAVTMEDLYPDPKWNFVYGMASLHDRVGVQSFARQDPAFFGEPREAGWQMQVLRRASWTLVHETSHMFGLTHCVFWRCVIAGANHQAEADRSPLHLCPVDLRKLQSSIRFDPVKREISLAATLRELGIDDEAAWSERRARWIRDGTR